MISMLGNKHVLIIIIILVFSFIGAQSTSQFYHKNPNQVYAGDKILLSVTMFSADPIISGMLFFRSKDQISYQEIPMNYSGGNWEASIPGRNVTGEGIEYVIILHKRSWGRISIPMADDPFKSPLFISISPKAKVADEKLNVDDSKKNKPINNENYVDADILILSPEPGSINRPVSYTHLTLPTNREV